MKKLSILLALILALSCFSFAASAIEAVDSDENVVKKEAVAENADTSKADSAKQEAPKIGLQGTDDDANAADDDDGTTETTETPWVETVVKVIYSTAHSDGSYHDSKGETLPNSWDRDSHSNWVDYKLVYFNFRDGDVVTGEKIINLLRGTSQNNGKGSANKDVINGGSVPKMVIDDKEFTLNTNVFVGLALDQDGNGHPDDVQVDPVNHPDWTTSLGEIKIQYDPAVPFSRVGFIAYAAENDDVAEFAQVAASQLGGYQWNGVAKANVALVNEIIKGFNASADVVAKELPAAVASNKAAAENGGKAVNGTTATSTSPKTGTSAVAGVAIVVLALATTTTVVLRKKED